MDIILLETVENLGYIGDRVKVRSGYARNFLLPKGKATLSTPENIAVFEARRAELVRKEANEMASSQARAEAIKGLSLELKANAGPEGKLFGSIGTIDIVAACAAADVKVERSEVRLPDGPIRMLGEHEVEIHLQADLNVTIRINVLSDGEPPAIVEDLVEDEPETDAESPADESAQEETDTD
jgi:large subunit ribosomal protein L9